MKTNAWTWALLVMLTTGSFWTRGALHGRDAVWIILAAAGVKCGGLGWYFMELRAAHWIWRAGLAALVFGVLGVVGVLAGRA
ncbi:cytochrome C oxidase subunit IV family protein [Horticoccus sp. 23ND18S-11]|uniref:cytochrome C oxidase subunit IV family protein n=1 Tax=Horticoccus sp. 23ND18S-11 TaxID=3391832 RepID=UPI0039C8C775